MPDSELQVPDDGQESAEGKSSDTKSEDLLAGIPDEEEAAGIKESKKDDAEKEKDSPRRAAIAQKIKYRERYQSERARREALEAENERLRAQKTGDANQEPQDDQERRAKEFIRNQAKEAFQELKRQEAEEERRMIEDFEERLETVLEEHSDFTEDQILNVVERFKVEPEVAAQILAEYESQGKAKPRLPQSKRGTPAAPAAKAKPTDKNKSMWQIAQDVIREMAGKSTT